MQRDTDLAFKDIHGAPDALLADLDLICGPATVTSIDSNGLETLDLRFLTFDNTDLDDNPLLHLTERGHHIGETKLCGRVVHLAKIRHRHARQKQRSV